MIEFLITFLVLSPVMVMVILANWAEKGREAGRPSAFVTVLGYTTPVLLYVVIFFLGISIQLVGVASKSDPATRQMFYDLYEDLIEPATLDTLIGQFQLIGGMVWIPALIAMALLFIRPIRSALARLIPINPQNHVHAVALSMIPIVLMPMLVLQAVGLNTFLGIDTATVAEAESIDIGQSVGALVGSLWGQQMATAVIGLLGVGFILRRDWVASFERLGLSLPSLKQIAIGIGVAVGMLFLSGIVIAISEQFGLISSDVAGANEELLGPLFDNLGGIITIGIAAALGEEIFFRGALQPRFGRLLTSILFAIVHLQYSLSPVTIVIFALGYVLGWLRDTQSTTTAIITHATFNMLPLMAAFIANQLGVFV